MQRAPRALPSRRSAVALAAAAGGLLTAAPALAAPCPASFTRVAAPAVGPGALESVAVASARDVWTVGWTGEEFANGRTLILRWDGAGFTRVPSPNPSAGSNRLLDVAVVGPNDVWAVGFRDGDRFEQSPRALTVHWDGVRWRTVPSPNAGGAATELTGVAAAGGEVIAAGWFFDTSGGPDFSMRENFAVRWNGTAWTRIDAGTFNGGGGSSINGAGPAGSAVVAAGGGSLMDGQTFPEGEVRIAGAWRHWATGEMPGPFGGDLSSGEFLDAAGIAPGDAWAVGEFDDFSKDAVPTRPFVNHWDGRRSRLSPVPLPARLEGSLRGVAAANRGLAWATGWSARDRFAGPLHALAFLWDGARWSRLAVPDGPRGSALLNAAAVAPGLGAGAVGSTAAARPRPLAMRVCPLVLTDAGPRRSVARAGLGQSAVFTVPAGTNLAHTVSDADGLGLVTLGPLAGPTAAAHAFTAAGTYRLADGTAADVHAVRVRVPMVAVDAAAARWATVRARGEYRYRVQIRRPGSATWTVLRAATRATGASLAGRPPGTYALRSRLVLVGEGEDARSGWSPALRVRVR